MIKTPCQLLALLVLLISSLGFAQAVYAKDEDDVLEHHPEIVSVTEATYRQEVIEATLPVILDVCAPADCIARLAATEKLFVHYAGRAKVVQLPTSENEPFMHRFKGLHAPVYVVKKGAGYAFADRKKMNDAEVRSFIDAVLAP